MANLAQTLHLLSIEAGGPGSGRHAGSKGAGKTVAQLHRAAGGPPKGFDLDHRARVHSDAAMAFSNKTGKSYMKQHAEHVKAFKEGYNYWKD